MVAFRIGGLTFCTSHFVPSIKSVAIYSTLASPPTLVPRKGGSERALGLSLDTDTTAMLRCQSDWF